MAAKVVLAVLLAGTLRELGESLILIGASLTGITIVWRQVLKPLVSAANHLVEAIHVVKGIDKRVAAIERRMAGIDSLVELARDEAVRDVRELLRRGHLPE